MWTAIASVSSIFTLVAFLAAVAAWMYRRRALQMERLVKLVPEQDRGPLVETMLDRVRVDTTGLTREQRYDLALRLIENRSRRFKALAVVITLVTASAAVYSTLAVMRNLEDAKERALTGFPPQIPFQTGWIFIGYHDSFSWVEGPMVAILYRAREGGADLLQGGIENVIRDLGSDAKQKFQARGNLPRALYLRRQEDLIRWRRDIEDPSLNNSSLSSIPALGDVLRIAKSRRVIVAEFRTSGLKNQLTFPGLVKGNIDSDDETGVELAKGALVIVRDVQIGAYPGRPAAVWCRIAACESGIPQCDEALQTVRRVP